MISAQLNYGPIGIVYEEELDSNGMINLLDLRKGNLAAQVALEGTPLGIGHAALHEPVDEIRPDIVVEIGFVTAQSVQLIHRELEVRAGLYAIRHGQGRFDGGSLCYPHCYQADRRCGGLQSV